MPRSHDAPSSDLESSGRSPTAPAVPDRPGFCIHDHVPTEVLEQLDEVVVSLSLPDELVLYISPSAERLFGRPRAELAADVDLLGATVHPVDRQRIEEIARASLGGGRFDEEFRLLRPDGSERRARARGRCAVDAAGVPQRLDLIVTDITEREEAESQLRVLGAWGEELGDFTDRLLAAAGDGIALFDREYRYVYISPASAAAIAGAMQLEPSAIIGLTSREVGFNDEFCGREEAAFARVLSEGAPITFQYQERFRGGSRWWETHASPMRGDDGEVTGIVSLSRNITDRKQLEERLTRVANALASAQRIAKIGSSRWDLGAEPAVSDELWCLYGLDPSTACRADLIARVHPEDRQLVLERTAGAWAGEAVPSMEFRILIPEHGVRVIRSHVEPERHPDGRVVCLLATEQDITEQREAEEQRHRLESQVRQAQKLESVGRLAAGIAHEMNTPMQFIGDNLRFLGDGLETLFALCKSHEELIAACRDAGLAPTELASVERERAAADLDYLTEELPRAVADSLDGVNRVSRIVGAMKEFSHPGTEDKVATDLNASIESTITIARNEWKYVATVETDLAPDLPNVLCFPAEFNQVLLNLIVNAVHAIAEAQAQSGRRGDPGCIRIDTRRDGEWAVVRVADNGTGVPESIRSRIFDPFFTTKDVGKGTGQGLSMAHAVIVERHGGRIDLQTETGTGSTFIVRLPLHPDGLPA